MGYNAKAELVLGFRPTKEEVLKLEEHEALWSPTSPDVGLYHSGDGRSELYDPVFGILIAGGYDWEPKKISPPKIKENYRDFIKAACKEYDVKYQQAHFYLVASVS
jgi:hypothetical protein